MKPISFPKADTILQKPKTMSDEECRPLPIKNFRGMCISCWKLSFLDRLRTLIFGKIWILIVSGKTQPPIAIETTTPPEIKE